MFKLADSPFGHSVRVVFLCLGLIFLPAAGQAAEEQAIQLEWQDLAAPDWESPMILPAPNENGEQIVDPDSLNPALAGKQVSLPGYMKPILFTGNSVKEFLLVPFMEEHVGRHAHLDGNQMVYVRLAEPVVVENPLIPYQVTGEIQLVTVSTPGGPTGYTISNAAAAVYKY